MKKILLVEDDNSIKTSLKFFLEKENFSVEIASTKKEAIERLNASFYDLILLDVTLPDGNGYELFQKIKEKKDIPIIFLTALDDEINVIQGFELGADDYITKPFRATELLLRMKAVLRRCTASVDELSIQNLKINYNQAKVYKNGEYIFLTSLEYKLLLLLVENRGKVMSREKLLANIWDVSEDYVNDNTLTVYIKRLREKIEENPNDPKIILTVRGIGYQVGELCE